MSFRIMIVAVLTTFLLLLESPADLALGQTVPQVDARIEIVWPHDHLGNQAPVSSARLVNVEVYLFQRGTLNPVGCDFSNQVSLHWARDEVSYLSGGGLSADLIPLDEGFADTSTGPITSVKGKRTVRIVEGKTFPVWVFNDVPVKPPRGIMTSTTTYFVVRVQDADDRSNVWAHGVDPRTFLPNANPPQAVGASSPKVVAALIQAVWPHDAQGHQQPAGSASLVNVAVDLVQAPADYSHLTSVGPGFTRPVHLLQALNAGFLTPVKTADQIITVNQTFSTGRQIQLSRWEFNEVDVSAAEDPANTYYFAAYVDGITTHPTIWAHGADARTHFPVPDIPATSGAGC